MEYLCTTCSKAKNTDKALLPAIQRYISERIAFVSRESKKLHKPFLILSGKYGLINAAMPIPWYDQALQFYDVPQMIPVLKTQLMEKQVSRMVFYGLARKTPGWEPYYAVLEKACDNLGIDLTFRELNLQ
ncbi:MAG: hypothetical protein H6696_19025 [Deferribacteres bacterium]|nr:hypothetical protein [candidate division KSB1 bacterium]MCB9504023.1 hypothetical protein [Deferribacteres bacterium]